ncbi:MAG: hypothetical protein ACRDE2_02410 [Chitinophagaceae bacterium]
MVPSQAAWLRNILFAIAFFLLVEGAFLRYKGHSLAWYFIGMSVLAYIIARFFMKRK